MQTKITLHTEIFDTRDYPEERKPPQQRPPKHYSMTRNSSHKWSQSSLCSEASSSYASSSTASRILAFSSEACPYAARSTPIKNQTQTLVLFLSFISPHFSATKQRERERNSIKGSTWARSESRIAVVTPLE